MGQNPPKSFSDIYMKQEMKGHSSDSKSDEKHNDKWTFCAPQLGYSEDISFRQEENTR